MKLLSKALLLFEVVICFGPVFMLLLMGFFVIPVALVTGEFGAWPILAMVICGSLGMVGLIAILINILEPGTKFPHPTKVKVYLLCGVSAMSFFGLGVSNGWGTVVYFLAPLLAGIHLAFLEREYLFGKI